MKRPLTIVVDAGETECGDCEKLSKFNGHWCDFFGPIHGGRRHETCLQAEALASSRTMPAEVRESIIDALSVDTSAWSDDDQARFAAAIAWMNASPSTTIRPGLLRFAMLMETKLRENDHKGGWAHESPTWLLRRLRDELSEVERVTVVSPSDKAAIARECADVANFAMMIADIYGGLAAQEAGR